MEILSNFMIKTVKYNLSGLHCSSCALNIEGALEDSEGIKNASVNYAKSVLEVEYDDTSLPSGKIQEIVKQTGYGAEEI